jgi:hypothetical protein
VVIENIHEETLEAMNADQAFEPVTRIDKTYLKNR